jgi:murein DD-endopeptidase MepM/ murein hydrolase activator NlpD
MARLVGIDLAQGRAKKDSTRRERPGFAILAGDENGARIFPLDGRVELKAGRLVIRFEKKDSVRVSGNGVVVEVIHNSLVNWMVTVQHKNGYFSTYSGNLSPMVKRGDVLKLGEAVGLATPPRFGSGKIEFGIFKAGQAVSPFSAFLDKTIDAAPLQGAKSKVVRNS